MKPEEPHLALVKLSAMGDVIHALPAAHALRRWLPGARLTWIVQTEIAPLLAPLRWLDAVVTLDRRGGWPAWWRLRRSLRAAATARPFDLAIDLQGNVKSGVVLHLTRAPRRVGLHRSDLRERPNAWFQTASPPAATAGHVIERALDLVGFALGRTPPSLAEIPWAEVLEIRDEERARARRHLPRTVEPAALLLLHITPRRDVRSWAPERYAALAERVLADGATHVLFVGGPGERAESTWLAEHVVHPRAHHVVAHRDLRDLLALHALVAGGRHAVVGTDCGPIQAALAGGLRTVFLHGPQDPRRTGPWRASDRALTAPEPLACRPCRARRCTHARGPVCVAEITVDAVHEAVRSLLGGAAPAMPHT